jgi:AcrR family transcriptional regulator
MAAAGPHVARKQIRKREPKRASELKLERPGRKNNPQRTKQDILTVATKEFARNGFSGGRIDTIAAKTRTTKRMIYYYFGSKEGLYIAVLEKVYSGIRAMESELHLEELGPEEAIRRLIQTTFDYDEEHPDFIRLVSIENIHRAEHLKKSGVIRELNKAVTGTLSAILQRGRAEGVFRAEIDPVDLHMLISAFCLFRVSNRHTFGTIFRRNFSAPQVREQHRRIITDAVLRFLRET